MRRAAATTGSTDAGPPPVTHVRNTTIAGNTPNAGHGGDEIVYPSEATDLERALDALDGVPTSPTTNGSRRASPNR